MTMALTDSGRSIDFLGERAGLKPARIRAEPHSSPHSLNPDQIPQLEDHRVRSVVVELSRVRAVKPTHVASELDRRTLHAQAYPEIRRLFAAGIVDRPQHARDAPFAEPSRHQDRVEISQ